MYGLTNKFSNASEIVLNCFGCKQKIISKNVIISPVLKFSDFDNFEIINTFGRKYWWKGCTGFYKGKIITIIQSKQSSNNAGDLVIALSYTRCKNVFFLGTAGSLSNDLYVGDIIIANEAINGEGFSQYYDPSFSLQDYLSDKAPVAADNKLLSKIKAQLNKNSIAFSSGKIFTIGSLFAENKKNISILKNNSIIGIDLETSAVYQAAQSYNIKTAAYYVVSDKVIKQEIFKGKIDKSTLSKLKISLKLLAKSALESL